MKLTAAEYARIRDPQLKATIDACDGELPTLGGGAAFWTIVLPGTIVVFGGETNRPANTEANQETKPLNLQDSPTLMTEWDFMNINLVGLTETRSEAAEAPASELTTVVQLLVGGDVMWQGSDTGPAFHEGANRFSKRAWRIAADLQNPIPYPRGRSVTLRYLVTTTIPTTQILTGTGGTGGIGGITQSTMNYTVRKLSGHREL